MATMGGLLTFVGSRGNVEVAPKGARSLNRYNASTSPVGKDNRGFPLLASRVMRRRRLLPLPPPSMVRHWWETSGRRLTD